MDQDMTCKLFPFVREDCISMQEVRQNAAWGITAFDLPNAWLASQGEGVVIGVCDSTPSWSPVIVRDGNGQIMTKTMEEVFQIAAGEIRKTNRGEEVRDGVNLEVWNGHSKHGKNWQKIVHVIRHYYNGTIKRVGLRGGIVDVTPNHSVIMANGRVTDAKDIVEGSRLCVAGLRNFPTKFGKFFLGGEELAWFMGFWAAEGSVYSCKNHPHILSVSQKEIEPLKKCQSIIKNI